MRIIPIGGGYFGSNAPDKSFKDLAENYGYNINTGGVFGDNYVAYNAPLYMPLGGTWYGGFSDELGMSGIFWSSTVNNSQIAYNFMVSYLGNADFDGGGRIQGYSIRCVAR